MPRHPGRAEGDPGPENRKCLDKSLKPVAPRFRLALRLAGMTIWKQIVRFRKARIWISFLVIPAQAGIQYSLAFPSCPFAADTAYWIPVLPRAANRDDKEEVFSVRRVSPIRLLEKQPHPERLARN
ncbi:hypothetical protein [Roseibium sp.]|uniref:hypothetical protein n=1 Tax=Roseibium sp. TaxID=1936156 RepID=UPI003BAC92F0